MCSFLFAPVPAPDLIAIIKSYALEISVGAPAVGVAAGAGVAACEEEAVAGVPVEVPDGAPAAVATTGRGCCVPAALPANGSNAIFLARLIATPSHRWCREHTPVMRRGRILPRSCTNCERMSARL